MKINEFDFEILPLAVATTSLARRKVTANSSVVLQESDRSYRDE